VTTPRIPHSIGYVYDDDDDDDDDNDDNDDDN